MADNQIHLKGDYTREELLAGGTITPGMLIEVTSSNTFQAHSTALGTAERLIAVEDALQGGIITDDYSSGDRVSANIELPGNWCQMFLASGETAVIGSKLESAGDGTLQVYTSGIVIAFAREAKDLSASGSVATLIDVSLL